MDDRIFKILHLEILDFFKILKIHEFFFRKSAKIFFFTMFKKRTCPQLKLMPSLNILCLSAGVSVRLYPI